jgi:toxin YhaV
VRVGDWEVYAHPLFLDQLEALTSAVDRARRKDPAGYANGRDAKMLAARKHWRRAKFYQQYRLFFRFSTAARVIVLAWVNDDQTRRAYGSRTDAYATFAKMLNSGDPPDGWEALLAAAKAPAASARLAAIPPPK